MLKFDASIFGSELPVGFGVVGIAVRDHMFAVAPPILA